MTLLYKNDLPQIILAGLGPFILLAAALLEQYSSLNSFLIWGVVWILICRNNYILHNHVHHPMFARRGWNRVFNIIFGLSAGMPAGNWKIMHVHGHHVEHKKRALKGRPYIERFIIPDDTQDDLWAFIKYAIRNTLPQMTIPIRELMRMSLGSGPRRQYGRYYLLDYIVIFIFLVGVAIISVKSAVIILSLYVIITFFSLRTDYSTHIGEKSDDEIAFANNCRDKLFNRFFWNFGYHVGHHMKPSLHWTQLPAYETSLGVTLQEDKIQTKSFNFFGLLMPPFLNWSSAKLAKRP